MRVGNKLKKPKKAGLEHTPDVPRKGRNYVAENVTYHETQVENLAERRAKYEDVTPVEGTHTHFHFYPVKENVIDVRFLVLPLPS